ncbi:charged multivesicular body protein 1a [Histomonas meleagridis]|uniref:charged multivesicular body protein 1a n=1 Tax=Histomonas meleagridis TaxID=135588 RepID=UPI0035598B66|nr:charged multivesicular body protein 1a [Histomonas meleagridis]KAH0805771.1 charged multivesicular body protein 1a [Histomonas meleagridis]
MQAKQLEREAKKMQKEAEKERRKAKNELKRGNRAAAQLYAQNAVRYEQQATQLLQSAATTMGYQVDMKNAQTSAQMARTMGAATKGMNDSLKHTNLQQISATRQKYDQQKDKMGAANMLIQGDSADAVSLEADDLMSQLEAETNEEAIAAFNDVPLDIPMENNGQAQALP